MPRTTLTKTVVPSWGAGLVDAGFEAVDNANGNDFVITKPTLVAVLNSSGGAALTVTINLPASRHTAEAATTKTAAVADTKIGLFLLLPDLHKQSDGKAWIDFSAATATVAVAELTHTPGFSY